MKTIPHGTVTSPQGFSAGAIAAGVKSRGGLDLGILYSERPCAAAGVFTANRVKAAPVLVSQRHLADGRAQAVVANAGCANACTGDGGFEDAVEMARLAAGRLGIEPGDVLVASTGVIGERLPMKRIEEGIEGIALSPEGGRELAQAILTTDTRVKETAVVAEGGGFTIGGIAKGAGMIHPNMGTLLSFLSTDAVIDAPLLERALAGAVDASFNMVTIDGDTSPNDMVLILASGVGDRVEEGSEGAEAFAAALTAVCVDLARRIAADGEGATRLIEVVVDGALTLADARLAARTVAGSPLVKAAVHGCDPNWGRVMAALGRSGAELDPSRVELYLDNVCLFAGGFPQPFDERGARAAMGADEVRIKVGLNAGGCEATAWGCDLTAEYVTINSEYTT